MSSSTRLRRALVVASCGALVSGVALLPGGAASALGPITAVYVVQGNSDAQGSGCTVTSGNASTPFVQTPIKHGKAKGSANLITTWTNGGNTSDVTNVTGHYGGTGRLAKHNGAFTSASVTGSGHVAITRALGNASTCDVYVRMLNAVEFITTQPSGWYYVTRSTVKGSLTEMLVTKDLSGEHPEVFEAYQGGANTVTQRAFVTSGQYVTVMAAGIESGDFPLILTKTANTNMMTASFHKAGSAFAKASGSGTRFVKFPGSVSCSHHKATLSWSGKAGQVSSGSFSVNGKKKASVGNPHAGRHIVLRHLSSTSDNKITANLSLTGGGKASASALYVPCKG